MFLGSAVAAIKKLKKDDACLCVSACFCEKKCVEGRLLNQALWTVSGLRMHPSDHPKAIHSFYCAMGKSSNAHHLGR